MNQRSPSPEPQGPPKLQAPVAVGKAPIAPGGPPPDSPPEEARGLALPHERDESVGNVASAPDPMMAQAAKDIAAGLVDTDMRNTGGQTQARRDALLKPGNNTPAPPTPHERHG